MATFTPPEDLTVPSTNVTMPAWMRRALSSATGVPRARNVFLYDDDTQVIEGALPPASYNADGTLDQTSEERLSTVFYGAHGAYTVTATQQATLEAAGYTVT